MRMPISLIPRKVSQRLFHCDVAGSVQIDLNLTVNSRARSWCHVVAVLQREYLIPPYRARKLNALERKPFNAIKPAFLVFLELFHLSVCQVDPIFNKMVRTL